ncbi:MAG: dephospho-CoA kinase [Chitinivibrionales bacterium]|nr:dephospho-CoA kinase [Chitinivibrionales bacterium]
MAHIGVAGYMGAGKSTVAQILKKHIPCRVIDADNDAKQLMNGNEKIRKDLVAAFGSDIIGDNTIIFHKLGEYVFRSLQNLKLLNSIVHPELLKHLASELEKNRKGNVICDAALIPLWGIESWFDTAIWIHADHSIRRHRLESSGKLDPAAIEKRMRLQEMLFDAPSGKPWYIIENNSVISTLEKGMKKLLEKR